MHRILRDLCGCPLNSCKRMERLPMGSITKAPERCASAIVRVRKPGAMRFSHRCSLIRATAKARRSPERCASAIVAVRKPRSDALQPSLQCGSPESDALQPSLHPASPADRLGSSSYVRRLKHVVPRSDALQPSLQCGSPGAMRFSHRFTRRLPDESSSQADI